MFTEGKTFSTLPSFFKSIFIHMIVVAAMFAYSLKFESIKKENLKLVEASMRVDVVAMPEFTIQEIRESIEQVESEPEAKSGVDNSVPEDEAFLREKENKKKNFMNLLKDLGKKKTTKTKKKPKKKSTNKVPSDQIRKNFKEIIMKGNKLNQGGLNASRSSSVDLGVLEEYSLSVKDAVRRYWNLPRYLKEMELQCRVRVYISKTGRLLRANVFESSGNSEYDKRALKAVKDAGQFPTAPEEIRGAILDGRIILGFPL